ncbi:uncharacterized protein LOC114174556 [Vigna unguiculata]|uniref:uncharacterized protein LOC114174556 n=1 Tax=Vigna unguiculata TaxID=3917 RepID=UPI0010163892|nr:uncharacterized protein LOC114174556 [Vigna unguiculata]
MTPLYSCASSSGWERKAVMGYKYEAMEKAKESIMKSFNNDESKYNDVFTIIDNRWTCQLHRPLHAAGHFLNPEFFYSNPDMEYDLEVTNGLYDCIRRLVPTPNLQKLAIKILSLTCSSLGCERNWSVFEQIHSKKRNRLDHKRLHDLVYIKYNQQLAQRYNIRDEIDPILLNDIDESSGIGELVVYTRREATNKRKQPSSDGIVIGSSHASKKGPGATPTPTQPKKGKKKTQIQVQNELHDSSDSEFERLLNFDNSLLEGEEEEGYAPLDDDIEDNHVRVEEEYDY